MWCQDNLVRSHIIPIVRILCFSDKSRNIFNDWLCLKACGLILFSWLNDLDHCSHQGMKNLKLSAHYVERVFSKLVFFLGAVSWRPTTVKWRQFSQSSRHSTIGTQETEYHEALPSSAVDKVRCDCTFADDANASWYSICRVPMVEWRLDCNN